MQRIFQQFGLAGTAIASLASLLAASPAAALSEQEILEKLDGIPVFLIVNSEGQSLTASIDTEDSSNLEVPIVFIDNDEAQSFLAEAADQGAEIANDANIVVYPLDEVYNRASDRLSDPNSLVYIPSAVSVQQASQILNTQQENAEFQGVPLYAAVNLDSEEYLLTSENRLPMFFSLTDLQNQVTQLIENNPGIEESIGVEVTTFETILGNMIADNEQADQLLQLVEFVPSSETLQYIQSISGEDAPAGGGN